MWTNISYCCSFENAWSHILWSADGGDCPHVRKNTERVPSEVNGTLIYVNGVSCLYSVRRADNKQDSQVSISCVSDCKLIFNQKLENNVAGVYLRNQIIILMIFFSPSFKLLIPAGVDNNLHICTGSFNPSKGLCVLSLNSVVFCFLS